MRLPASSDVASPSRPYMSSPPAPATERSWWETLSSGGGNAAAPDTPTPSADSGLPVPSPPPQVTRSGTAAAPQLLAVAHFAAPRPPAPPTLLGLAIDCSKFGFFVRPRAEEYLLFLSRQVAARALMGRRQSISEGDHVCFVNNCDGLVGICITNAAYPMASAFGAIGQALDAYTAEHGSGWRTATADTDVGTAAAQQALTRCQDPLAADRLAKVHHDLDETRVVLHKTLESLLERDGRLQELVDKSDDLSAASKMFARHARRTNSCCTMM